MKFTLSVKEANKLFKSASKSLPRNTVMQMLEAFVIEANNGIISCLASDLESRTTIKMEAVIHEEGIAIVNAKGLMNVVSSYNGDDSIIFETSKSTPDFKYHDRLKTVCGKSKYNFPLFDPIEYPIFDKPKASEINEVVFDKVELFNALKYAQTSLSDDELRPAMQGYSFEFDDTTKEAYIVTTEGHKLSACPVTARFSNPGRYIIPGSAVEAILDIEDNEITIIFGVEASVTTSDREFVTRLIKQKYPEWRGVLPQVSELVYEAKVNTKDFMTSLKRLRAGILSKDEALTEFDFTEKEVVVSAQSVNTGRSANEIIEVYSFSNLQGGEEKQIQVGFNINILLTEVDKIKSDYLLIQMVSDTRGAFFKGDGEKFYKLFMPLRRKA